MVSQPRPGERSVLIGPDEGVVATTGDNTVVIKLFGEETGGLLSIIEEVLEPGILIPPHTHQNDVWLYALEGETGAGWSLWHQLLRRVDGGTEVRLQPPAAGGVSGVGLPGHARTASWEHQQGSTSFTQGVQTPMVRTLPFTCPAPSRSSGPRPHPGHRGA